LLTLNRVAHAGFNAVMKKIIEEERTHLAALEDMKRSRLG
jgi:hypothetical protein